MVLVGLSCAQIDLTIYMLVLVCCYFISTNDFYFWLLLVAVKCSVAVKAPRIFKIIGNLIQGTRRALVTLVFQNSEHGNGAPKIIFLRPKKAHLGPPQIWKFLGLWSGKHSVVGAPKILSR